MSTTSARNGIRVLSKSREEEEEEVKSRRRRTKEVKKRIFLLLHFSAFDLSTRARARTKKRIWVHIAITTATTREAITYLLRRKSEICRFRGEV